MTPLLALWHRADRWMERAVLRQLPVAARRLLDAGLVVVLLAACALSLAVPGAAGAVLLLALMIACFFKGRWAGLLLLPLMVVHHALRGNPVEDILFVGGGLLGILFAVVTTHKYRETRRHEQSLQEGLELARRLQQALRPPALTAWGSLEVAAFSAPCEAVGGDFLLLRPLEGDRFAVLLGDVVGKGVSAALVSAYVDGLFHELARKGTGPAGTAEAINRSLTESFPSSATFATLMILEADLRRGVWKYCRAGHEPGLLRRADGTWRALEEGGMAAGIEGAATYGEGAVALQAGDQVFLATDGLLGDNPCRPELVGLLAETAPLDPGAALQILVERLASGFERFGSDDATAALVRVTA